MNKTLLTIAFLMIVKVAVYSQADFIPGYIQTSKNDTLFGFIDNKEDKANSIECRFRKTLSEPVQIFEATQIYGYRFTNGKYYVSRLITENKIPRTLFMEYLVEGVVDLYFYRNLRGDHYLLGKRNLPIKEISFPDEIIEKEGIPFKRNILVNTYVIKFYLQDCPEIFADIDKLTNPKHKILIQLIKKYHDIYCPDNVCLIYQKKMPKFRVDIQPIIGITNVNYSIVFDIYNKVNAFSLQYGVLTYFWLPLDNEKLFLKTGIIYNQVKGYYYSSLIHNSFEIRGVKIPLQVNYNLLKTGITPVMSAGLNIYSTTSIPFAVVPAIGVGINAKITDRLYATLSSELDFLTTPINLVQIISHSFNLGLAVKL